MSKGLLKWVDSLVALLVLGPIAYFALATLRAPDGDPFTTLLTSATPLKGALLGLVVVGLALVAALISGLLFGRGRGICMAGLVAGWAAWAGGSVRHVLGDADAPSAPSMLTAELLFVAILVVAAVIIVELRASIPGEELGRPDLAHSPPPSTHAYFAALKDPTSTMGIGAAAAACGILVYILAFSGIKGQSLFAAIVGGVGAGAAFGLVWSSRHASQDKPMHAPLLPPIMGVFIVGLIGSVAATFVPISDLHLLARAVGADGISGAVSNKPALLSLSTVMPMEWVTGALLGVPLGATWSTSMVDKGAHASARA